MRKLLFLTLAVALVTSCGKDATSPVTPQSSAQADGTAGPSATSADPGLLGFGGVPGLFRLPDNLKLTAEQQAAVTAAVRAFEQSNQADLKALADIAKQAADAIKAGKSRADVKAIVDQGAPIRARLEASGAALRTKIAGILTQAQKDWLATHIANACATTAPPLSDAQKTQIKALRDAFAAAHKVDLDAIKAVMQQARDARQAGKSREEIRTILDAAKPARDRVRAAHQKLRADIDTILTPEQRAARCNRAEGRGRMGGFGGPGGFGGHGALEGRLSPDGPRRGYLHRGPISS